MTPRAPRFLVALSAALLVASIPGVASGGSPDRPLARNVILMIDDGAGYAAHELGSLYDTGLRAGEPYQAFPFQFGVSTYSYGDVPVGACGDLVGYDAVRAWSEFDYVIDAPTDSASAATAMASGSKTYDRAIGVDCAGSNLPNVVERAEADGRSTGVVTSVPFSHATPAAFVAHVTDRDSDKELARQMIELSSTDVIMGGGHPRFDRSGVPSAPGYAWVSTSTWGKVTAGTVGADADGDGTADPWTFIQERSQFQALATGPTPERVLGIAQVRRTLQEDRVDLTTLPAGTIVEPYSVPRIETVPTLAEMSAGALNVLDNDPEGFFLMIEGGATDWAAHDQQPGLMVEEEIAFDDAVDAVLAWVDANSNWGETLLVVTSDHETGYVTGPGSAQTEDGPVWTQLVDHGPGVLPGVTVNIGTHTNSLVPVYAKGDAGRLLRAMADETDPVRGAYIDNIEIHTLIMRALGIAPG